MKPLFEAFIGLGGNLGDATATLKSAIASLRALTGTEVDGISSLYRSAAIGPAGQPDYFNAVARVQTCLTPHALLAALHVIENAHGRVRQERWGARTLDLDLLLFAKDEIESPELRLPHPEMTARNFVLIPLLEIAPGQTLPDGRLLAELPAANDHQGLEQALAQDWAD